MKGKEESDRNSTFDSHDANGGTLHAIKFLSIGELNLY